MLAPCFVNELVVSTVSCVFALSLHAGVGLADPPVAVSANVRSNAVCASSTGSTGSTSIALCACITLFALGTACNKNATDNEAHN